MPVESRLRLLRRCFMFLLMGCTQLAPGCSPVQLPLNQIHVGFFNVILVCACEWIAHWLVYENIKCSLEVQSQSSHTCSAALGHDRLAACAKLFGNTVLASIWAAGQWWKRMGKKRFFWGGRGQPRILHPTGLRRKCVIPGEITWHAGMARSLSWRPSLTWS